jgi:hypothetical protein
VKNVIEMDHRIAKGRAPGLPVRDRRYAIRYPFAADIELLDLESGARSTGVTSDVSLGGCFVCTSKPLSVRARVRVTMSRKNRTAEALGVVRVVKPRVGMGVEFIDIDAGSHELLRRWIEELRSDR